MLCEVGQEISAEVLEDGDIVTRATVQHIVTKASDKRIVASLTLQMIGTVATR